MVEHEKPSGERQPRRKRWRRWLVGSFLAILLLPLVAYATRDLWLGPYAVRTLERLAREELGAELTIERVSGSWLNGVVLEGVRWRASQSPLRALEEGRVELEWSLRGLLRQEPGLRVRVTGRGLELALPHEPGAPDAAEDGPRKPLPDLEHLELELAGVRVHQPGVEPFELARLRARGGLADMRAHVEELELLAGENRITLANAELDLAAGDGLAIARSLRGQLEAQIRLGAAEERALTELLGRPLPLHSVALALRVEDGRAQLAGTAELAGGSLAIEQGEVVWPAGAPLAELGLALRLRAELRDLGALAPVLGTTLAGSWRGSVDVEGPLRAPSGRFVGQGEGLVVAGVSLGALDVDVHTDGVRARFERCEISGPELEAVLRGELQFEPLELHDVALNVSADRGALEQLLPLPIEHAFLHTRLDGPLRAPRGDFEFSASGASLGSLRIDDAEARGSLDGTRFEIAELRLTSGESFVEASGTLERASEGWSAELAHLAIAWRGALAEVQPGARLAFGDGRFAVDGLVLTSAGGAASPEETPAREPGRATVELRHEPGRTRVALNFEDYHAGALLAPFLPAGLVGGRVDGSVDGSLAGLGGAASESVPELALDLALLGWRVSPDWPALDGVLRGSFDGRELALERIELGYEGDEGARLAGTLRIPLRLVEPQLFAPGRVELELEAESGDLVHTLARADLEPGPTRTGPCRLELALAGEWHALEGRLTLAASEVTLGRNASARACDLEAELTLGRRIELERALFSAPSGSITLAGAIGTPFDPAGWRADPWTLYEAPLVLTAKLDLADIAWVAGLSNELRRTSGQVAGTLGIAGNLLQPELSGALELREGEVRLASSAPPVRSLMADLRFEDQIVHVERLTGEIGGAPMRVSGTVEPFGPFPRLDLVVAGENLLLTRDARLRVRADSELVVKGTPSQLVIRGEMALAEGRYTGEISPLEELMQVGRRNGSARNQGTSFTLWSEGPLASAELDIHLGGARTFEYRTNLLSASLRPDAWLRGTGAFPVLEGPVYVETASLTLPSGELELTSGLLNFRRDAPLSPELALTAEMRVQRHDVRAVVSGALDGQRDFEIVLSSTPPLPPDDLWILVLTGQLPQSRWQDRSSQAMEALALFLARDSLVRWFGSEPDDTESLLERFEIDVGAETSRSGQPTGRVVFYLKPQDRRSGRATYLSAELDEYDRVNYAFGIVFRPR